MDRASVAGEPNNEVECGAGNPRRRSASKFEQIVTVCTLGRETRTFNLECVIEARATRFSLVDPSPNHTVEQE